MSRHVRRDEIVVTIPHMRIVDEETFARVEARRQPEGRHVPRPEARNVRFLLAGRCRCECGRILGLGGSGSGDRIWTCDGSAADHRGGRAHRNEFPLRTVEIAIVEGLQEFLDPKSHGWAFLERARSANAQKQEQIASDRRMLEDEIAELDRSIERHMAARFKGKRVSQRFDAYVEKQIERLDEMRARRQTMVSPRTLREPEAALSTLGAEFETLMRRAPFIPANPAEWAVRDCLRRIVRTVYLRRVRGGEIEIEVDYDLGSVVGDDSGSGIVRRSFGLDTHAIAKEARPLRRERVEAAITSGEFAPGAEALDAMSADLEFQQLLGSYPEETRKAILHSFILRMVLIAPNTMVWSMVPSLDPILRGRILEFRRSEGALRLGRVAMAFYPGVDIRPNALRIQHTPVRRTARKFRLAGHPFMELDICRPDGGATRIPESHARAAADVLSKAIPRKGRLVSHIRDVNEVVRLLEISAFALRTKVGFDEAALRHGLQHVRLGSWFSLLEHFGKLRPIAERLLAQQRQDASRVPALSTLPVAEG